MSGGSGDDIYILDSRGDTVGEADASGIDTGGIDRVYASADFTLGDNLEHLYAYQALAGLTLVGNGLNNAIVGSGFADMLKGGGGGDKLNGGAGNDTFVFTSVADSTSTRRDTIRDFSVGDYIDLTAIMTGAGDSHFHFNSGSSFHKQAGELIAVKSGTSTYVVQGDTDGDGNADLFINVVSDHTLAGGDFLLV